MNLSEPPKTNSQQLFGSVSKMWPAHPFNGANCFPFSRTRDSRRLGFPSINVLNDWVLQLARSLLSLSRFSTRQTSNWFVNPDRLAFGIKLSGSPKLTNASGLLCQIRTAHV